MWSHVVTSTFQFQVTSFSFLKRTFSWFEWEYLINIVVIHDYWSCSSKEEVSPVSSFTSTGVDHQTYDSFAIVSALKHKIRIICKTFANQNFPKHSLKYCAHHRNVLMSLYRWKKWWNVILLLWCDLVCRLYLFFSDSMIFRGVTMKAAHRVPAINLDVSWKRRTENLMNSSKQNLADDVWGSSVEQQQKVCGPTWRNNVNRCF